MNEITTKPPPRHQNQQGRVLEAPSRKVERLLTLYADELPMRCSPRTVDTYLRNVRFFLAWLCERGLLSPDDLQKRLEGR